MWAAQGQGELLARTAFRFALDEIGALAGLTTDKSKRAPVPERYALQAAVMVATVRK